MDHVSRPDEESVTLDNPASVTLIRHGQSLYNELKEKVKEMPGCKQFRKQFNKDMKTPDLDLAVLEGRWPSPELKALALEYYREVRQVMNGVDDFGTPLTEQGIWQAKTTGERMAYDGVPKPDIIYYSPYLRTRQTLEHLLSTAPDDWMGTTQWEHASIREQEHGMQTVFNDWRLSYVFEPMDMLHARKEGEYSYRYKGGESKYDVQDRASRFIGHLRRKHAGENVMLVTHHLTILSFLAEVQHWTRDQFLEWDEKRKPSNCGVTILRREEGVGRRGSRSVLTLQDQDYNKVLWE